MKTLIEILQCYVVTAEQLTNALAEACAEEKWDEAARLAQDIVGAAGGLGLAAITQAARHFAQASARRREPSRTAQRRPDGGGRTCPRARQALIQSLSRRRLVRSDLRNHSLGSSRSHASHDRAPMDSLASLIALVPAPPGAAICARDGAVPSASAWMMRARFSSAASAGGPCRLCRRAAEGRARPRPLFDVLELFAFVRPGHALGAQRAGPGAGAGAGTCRTRRKTPRARSARHCADACWRNGRLAAGGARKPRAAGRHAGARGLALGAAAERASRAKCRTARPSPAWKPGAACRNGKTKRRWASPGSQPVDTDGSARAAGAAGGHAAPRTGGL